MLRFSIILIFISKCFTCAFTQIPISDVGQKKDSLYQVIINDSKNVSSKIGAIKALFTDRIAFDDKIYLQVDKLLLNTTITKEEKINLHHYSSIGYYRNGELSKAEYHLEKAYKYYKKYRIPHFDPFFLVNYGLVKNNLGKNNEAISIYLEAIDIAENTDKHSNLGNLYVKMGDLYNNMKEYDDARKYLQKATDFGHKANDKKVVAYAQRSLGITALESGNFEEAEIVFKNTLTIFDTLQHNFMINDVKCYLAATYDEMDRFDEAEKLFDEAHQFFENSGNVGDLYYIAVDKGKHFFRKGDYNKAIESCEYAKDNLMKIGDIAWATKAWLCMYDAAKISGDYKKALEYYQGYIKYNDSITNEKNIQKITELNKEFEFTKEKEVIALENDQEIQKEKIFQKFLGLGLLLISVLAFFSYRAYLIKTKANKTISSQNTQLMIYSKTNENLIDSLTHDIKEPMLGLHLLLSKIKSDDPFLKHAMQSIGDQVLSINNIVNNLLQLKKSNLQNSKPTIDINSTIEIIEKVNNQLKYKLEEKNLQLVNMVNVLDTLTLPISSHQLYIVLLNLITNAIKHSPNNQKIEIFATKDGIFVRDYGLGIDPNIIHKLGKENLDLNTNQDNSGLGIIFLNNMLEGSNVKLKFENALGGGTLAGVDIMSKI